MPEKTETLKLPMSEVLSRFAAEIRDLARATEMVQDAISPLVANDARCDYGQYATLQSLDATHQTLLGIAQIMDDLKSSIFCDCQVDMAEACRRTALAGLADRMAVGRENIANTVASHGHVDCF